MRMLKRAAVMTVLALPPMPLIPDDTDETVKQIAERFAPRDSTGDKQEAA